MKLTLLSMSIALSISPLFADTQTSLTALQAQINSLQSQINRTIVGVDTASPFGTMSKVEMPLQLIRARSLDAPPIVLGAKLEADLQYWNGSSNIATNSSTTPNYGEGSNVGLEVLNLYTEANLGKDALGFISLKTNSVATNMPGSYQVAVDRAFLIIGDLNQRAPIFLTLGSTFLPFGSFYGNPPLNNTLTTTLFRVSPTNQASLNGVFGPLTLVASAFNNTSAVNNTINGLFTVYFNKTSKDLHYNFGASYLSNIVGTNSGIGDDFSSSGNTTSAAPLESATNPVIDLNFNVGSTLISFIGEYDATTRTAYNQNQSVGKLSAWTLGFMGVIPLLGIPYNWQSTYSKTYNMQNVPILLDGDHQNSVETLSGFKNQWTGSIQGQYWQNVYIGPELSYGALYSNQHTYSLTLDATAYF